MRAAACVVALLWLLCQTDFSQASPSPECGVQDEHAQHNAFEVHQVLLTVAENVSLGRPETEQHLRAREGLLQRMSRKHGTYNEQHPRYRLFEALRGYSAYAQTHQAELNRLKGLYRHVSKKQKAVSAGGAQIPFRLPGLRASVGVPTCTN